MKKTKITILSTIILVFCTGWFARAAEGRFKIKEGDWFEIRTSFPFNLNESSLPNFLKGPDKQNDPFKSEVTAWLRYELKSQRSNGNQVYNVSIKRIQSKTFAPGFLQIWYGHDSYYPIFQDNKDAKKPFIQFSMEVTPSGSISRFDSISGYRPEINLVPISPKKEKNIMISMDYSIPSNILEFFSSFLMFAPNKTGVAILKPNGINQEAKIETLGYAEDDLYRIYTITANDTIATEFKCLKNEGIPVSLDNAQLVAASFQIPANTLIKGKLSDQANQEVVISLEGNNEEEYFENKHFKINNDGTFHCPIFLNRPLYLKIQVGKKEFYSFIEPNDTLEVLAIDPAVNRISVNFTFSDDSRKAGYMVNTTDFAGNAAYNAKLSIEMNEWIKWYLSPNDLPTFQNYRKAISENTNVILATFKGKASANCIEYFRTRRDYFLANVKLMFYEDQRRLKMPFTKSKNTLDYSPDFFMEIDTIPTIMHPYEWCSYYQYFIEKSFKFKKDRLEMSVGGQTNDFYPNYFFARASLKGWPLYNTLYKELDKEIRKGHQASLRIEPLYRDFINNCKNPKLTEPLIKLYKSTSMLEFGNTFPFKTFVQQDSSIFDLSKYKGKPVCLAFIEAPKRDINDFKRDIDKFNSDEVEFIFICLPQNFVNQEPLDSTLLARPNVHVIEVPDLGLRDRILLSQFSKIYMLDKWLRIVDDNMLNPSNNIGFKGFEESVKKAIEAKRYSKAEKTAFFKTAGWSFGSILFTFLIGLWIYKVRVHRIKRQEATKRRMKELEIKAIRSQMNPHFIFNALNSIQSLINENQFKQANIYLSKFALLLREVLNNSEKAMVTLSDELKAVELYCQLEQLRFEFQFAISVSPEINSQLIEIPGMIIQPLAENAVVHGLLPKGIEGRLTIEISKQIDDLCICVSDNGPGLTDPKNDRLGQKGFGLKLIEERIKVLNIEGKSARLTLQNRADNQGAMATLIIPID